MTITIDVSTLTNECLVSIYKCCFECDGIVPLTKQVVTEATKRNLLLPSGAWTPEGLTVWTNVEENLNADRYNYQVDIDLWKELAHWDDAHLVAHLESIRAQSPGSADEMPAVLPTERSKLVDLLEKLGDGDLDEVM
jgi:hypothetical protein